MDSFNDLQELWHKANTTALPGAGDMMRAIRKYSLKMLFKKAALVTLGLALAVCMVAVMFWYRSAMVTTRIGECCILAACLLFVKVNIGSVARAYRLKDHSNREFISYLEQLPVKRLRYYRGTQVLALSLASVGLAFYFFEPFHNDVRLSVIAYAFLAAYVLLMWLVVRPRAFRRRQRKLQATIDRMRRLADQL
ncbi:MAG: hypothetical protein JSS82_09485 [Bacteroidetes bacterium]|nr:hypothetical protein [Bacteroidota bacterium]